MTQCTYSVYFTISRPKPPTTELTLNIYKGHYNYSTGLILIFVQGPRED